MRGRLVCSRSTRRLCDVTTCKNFVAEFAKILDVGSLTLSEAVSTEGEIISVML